MAKKSLATRLRVVWAIASKDIVEALRNKSSVALILTALLLVVGYHFLPALHKGDPTALMIYDAGTSALVPLLEDQSPLNVRVLPSQVAMATRVTDEDLPALGLVIPADFDARLNAGGTPELTGYVVHWVSSKDAERLQQLVEGEVAALLGTAVPIRISDERLYPTPQSGGVGVMVGMAFVFVVTIVGLMVPPNLMIEEKETRTLDALLVSPATPGEVVLGKAASGIVYALTGAGVSFIINRTLVLHWGLASAAAIGGALYSTAIGLLIGSLLERRQQLMMWAQVVFVPLFIPLILMLLDSVVPSGIVAVARWVPTSVLFNLLRASMAGAIEVTDWAGLVIYLFSISGVVLAAVAWIVRRSDR